MDCIFTTSFIVWIWVWKHWYMQWGESMGEPFGSRKVLESMISEPLVLFWVFWKQIFKVLARYKAWWPCLFSLCVFSFQYNYTFLYLMSIFWFMFHLWKLQTRSLYNKRLHKVFVIFPKFLPHCMCFPFWLVIQGINLGLLKMPLN